MSLLQVAASVLLAGTSHCPAELGSGTVPPAMAQPALVTPDPAAQSSVIIAQTTKLQLSNTVSPAEIAPVASAAPPLQTTPPSIDPATPAAAETGLTPPVEDAEIVVTAKTGPPPGDPAEAVNEVSFAVVQAVDQNLVAPVAHGYQQGIPGPIRLGVHNVLNNLDEPIVFVNFLLQLKIGKAFETAGRFAINSTLGVGGLIDVAKKKPFNLPRRSNGLADTLGYYGVGPGPYLFLPLIGSTSVRDLLGRVADLSLLPTVAAKPFAQPLISLSKGVLSSIDDRVENDEILTRVQHSDNPYAAMREYYLTKRQAEIDVLRGKRCNSDINLDELPLLSEKAVPQTTTPAGLEAR